MLAITVMLFGILEYVLQTEIITAYPQCQIKFIQASERELG
jgi:hypothetical protein